MYGSCTKSSKYSIAGVVIGCIAQLYIAGYRYFLGVEITLKLRSLATTGKLQSLFKRYYLLKMVKIVMGVLALCCVMSCSTGCATLFSKRNYPVVVTSDPPGAEVVVATRGGKIVSKGMTPTVVTLKAADGWYVPANYVVMFRKADYFQAGAVIEAQVDGWYWANMGFSPLSILGLLLIDPAVGSMYRLNGSLHCNMLPLDGRQSSAVYRAPYRPQGGGGRQQVPKLGSLEKRVR